LLDQNNVNELNSAIDTCRSEVSAVSLALVNQGSLSQVYRTALINMFTEWQLRPCQNASLEFGDASWRYAYGAGMGSLPLNDSMKTIVKLLSDAHLLSQLVLRIQNPGIASTFKTPVNELMALSGNGGGQANNTLDLIEVVRSQARIRLVS